MSDQPNKFTKFWQELKRRKVVKVTIIYATTAFILLQLIDMLIKPLHLPDWIMTFFVVLLLVGFFIVVILAWIFDVTPHGIEVTPSVDQKIENTITFQSRRKETILDIIIGILIIVVVILVWPKLFNSRKNGPLNPDLEKSIAVLPFIDDSPEKGNSYIINGLMDEILNKLEKVNDLSVKSRTDSEKYRDSQKSIKEIANELGVNYILEGSGQKIGGKIKLMLQLIDTKSGNHLWSKPYINEVNEDNIFELQNDVAFSVVSELKAIITPEEKEQIEKKPTENLAAYNLYLQGLDYLNLIRYNVDYSYGEALSIRLKAKYAFKRAVELDTTFAEAYACLAHIYISFSSSTANVELNENYLDSGLIMANKAIYYDENNAWAYSLRGNYFIRKGLYKEAEQSYEQEDKVSVGRQLDWEKYYSLFWRYGYLKDNYKQLENFYKYKETKPENVVIQNNILTNVCNKLSFNAYPEVTTKYAKKILDFDDDSAGYYNRRQLAELFAGNFEAAKDYGIKSLKIMPTNSSAAIYLFGSYVFLKDYSSAYKIILTWENSNNGFIPASLLSGYNGFVYLKNGRKKEADDQFQKAIAMNLKEIEQNLPGAQNFEAQLNLASVYSAQGNKTKALEYFKMLKKTEIVNAYFFNTIKYSPMLDNIRNEPEFKEVFANLESKYQKEHERIGELLREHGDIK